METFELNCRFCGIKTGSIQGRKGETPKSLGILDSRCGDCEKIYGSYKKASDSYITQGKTFRQFESDIQDSNFNAKELNAGFKGK